MYVWVDSNSLTILDDSNQLEMKGACLTLCYKTSVRILYNSSIVPSILYGTLKCNVALNSN